MFDSFSQQIQFEGLPLCLASLDQKITVRTSGCVEEVAAWKTFFKKPMYRFFT
jgi:hypothetical protein